MSKLYIRDSNGNVESIRLQKHSLINAKQGDKLFFTNQYDSFYFKMLNNAQDLQIIFKTGINILSFIVKKIIQMHFCCRCLFFNIKELCKNLFLCFHRF